MGGNIQNLKSLVTEKGQSFAGYVPFYTRLINGYTPPFQGFQNVSSNT